MMYKMKEGYGDGELTLYPTQVFSVNNWALKPNQPEEPPFTTHMLAICSIDKPAVFKAPKPSSNIKRVPQGIKPGAKPRHKKHSTSLKQPYVSSKEATQVSTPVDTGMHKEDQQATGGPTSLGVTSKVRVNPQLSSGNDASVASTTEVNPGNSAPSDFVPQQQGMNEGTKNTSYDHLFADLDSPKDDPVIVVDDSNEDEDDEVHATKNVETEDTLVPKSSSPMSSQIQELTNQVLIRQSQKHKLELEKKKAEAEAALLKAQPSFPNVEQLKELLFNELTEEVKELKQQVHELEIELIGELKEIPSKLEEFTKTITSLTSQVAELKTLKWELPEEFVSPPVQAASVQSKLKTLDALLSILLNVIKALNKFCSESSSQPEGEQTKIDKGKKAMSSKDAKEESTESNSDDETTHVPGSTVESSKKKELKGFDFVTKDGEHVHLTKEQINVQKKIEEEQINTQKKIEEEAKAEAARREGEIRKKELIDLLGPEVVNKYYNDKLQYDRYCDKMLNRRAKSRITNCDILTRKGPITLKVYREDDTSKIIPEFKASDLHIANKRVKLSVQNKDHPAGTVLNKPVLEIFFRLHQGPGLDDHARTFSSLLLAKIDKRNLNPLKQIRVIKQLRQ
ncbi:hypothetical protein Tco_0618497 [Tanacetum coccineum]